MAKGRAIARDKACMKGIDEERAFSSNRDERITADPAKSGAYVCSALANPRTERPRKWQPRRCALIFSADTRRGSSLTSRSGERETQRMPRDAKFGLIVGVAVVVAISVIFFRKEPAPSAPRERETAPAAVGVNSVPPVPARD